MSRGVGVTEALRAVLPEWALPLFELFALPGDLLVIVPLLALLYLSDVTRSLRQSSNDGPLCSDRTAFVIATVFGGLALVVLLKAVFSFPRPPTELHAVTPSEYGFPSGHTMAATITWGGVAWWTTVGRRRTRLAVAAVLVALVALSRLALGVHFLIDPLASVVIGVAYLAGTARLALDRPDRAFTLALGIATLAVVASGASTRGVLAFAGTVGAGAGWWLLERPPVRRRLAHAFGRVGVP